MNVTRLVYETLFAQGYFKLKINKKECGLCRFIVREERVFIPQACFFTEGKLRTGFKSSFPVEMICVCALGLGDTSLKMISQYVLPFLRWQYLSWDILCYENYVHEVTCRLEAGGAHELLCTQKDSICIMFIKLILCTMLHHRVLFILFITIFS